MIINWRILNTWLLKDNQIGEMLAVQIPIQGFIIIISPYSLKWSIHCSRDLLEIYSNRKPIAKIGSDSGSSPSRADQNYKSRVLYSTERFRLLKPTHSAYKGLYKLSCINCNKDIKNTGPIVMHVLLVNLVPWHSSKAMEKLKEHF